MTVDASTPPIDHWFHTAIAAARRGEHGAARELFTRIILFDDEHLSAWVWLTGLARDRSEQALYIEEVRAICLGPDYRPPVAAWHPAVIHMTPSQQPAPQPRPRRLRLEQLAAAFSALGSHVRPYPRGAALAFLAAVTLAELLVTFADPRLGLGLHCMILVALLVGTARAGGDRERALFVTLAFAPLIRIMSLSLPLPRFPVLYWYLITSIPLFAAALVAARTLGYRWHALGITLRGWPLQLAVAAIGLLFGAVEYLILKPAPIAESLSWQHLWAPALILLVCTGLLEEVLFRGLMQRAAGDLFAGWGIAYIALLFGVLHLGYRSAVDVLFVLGVGLFFGWIVQRTHSLLGVTIAHGLTNIMLFLIMPFVAGI